MGKVEDIRALGRPQMGRLLGASDPAGFGRRAEDLGELRRRVAELEVENADLRARLRDEKRSENSVPKIENIGTRSENGWNKGTRGRPKSSLSKAERQRAYRGRKAKE